MPGYSSVLQTGCRRTLAQPDQQAHEVRVRAPALHSKAILGHGSKQMGLHKPDSHVSEFVPYGEHKESLPGEACVLGASGHW